MKSRTFPQTAHFNSCSRSSLLSSFNWTNVASHSLEQNNPSLSSSSPHILHEPSDNSSSGPKNNPPGSDVSKKERRLGMSLISNSRMATLKALRRFQESPCLEAYTSGRGASQIGTISVPRISAKTTTSRNFLKNKFGFLLLSFHPSSSSASPYLRSLPKIFGKIGLPNLSTGFN